MLNEIIIKFNDVSPLIPHIPDKIILAVDVDGNISIINAFVFYF